MCIHVHEDLNAFEGYGHSCALGKCFSELQTASAAINVTADHRFVVPCGDQQQNIPAGFFDKESVYEN